MENQEADNSSQAVKRRLPREIKLKLAKVARLAVIDMIPYHLILDTIVLENILSCIVFLHFFYLCVCEEI